VNRPALPEEHAGVRWVFASLYLTVAVIWLLFRLELLRNGESGPPWPFAHVAAEDFGWIALLFCSFEKTRIKPWLSSINCRAAPNGMLSAAVW
jgi:hypothetical protein